MEHNISPHTLTCSPHRQKGITRRKVRFYYAIDTREREKTIKDMCNNKNLLSSSDGKTLTSDGNSVMASNKSGKADHERELCVLCLFLL